MLCTQWRSISKQITFNQTLYQIHCWWGNNLLETWPSKKVLFKILQNKMLEQKLLELQGQEMSIKDLMVVEDKPKVIGEEQILNLNLWDLSYNFEMVINSLLKEITHLITENLNHHAIIIQLFEQMYLIVVEFMLNVVNAVKNSSLIIFLLGQNEQNQPAQWLFDLILFKNKRRHLPLELNLHPIHLRSFQS